jgi:hypothetical protein
VTFKTAKDSKQGSTTCAIVLASHLCRIVGSWSQPTRTSREPDKFSTPPVSPLMRTATGMAMIHSIQAGRGIRVDGLRRSMAASNGVACVESSLGGLLAERIGK